VPLKTLLRSPTLRSMVIYGAAGAGFAIANLILARALPKAEYAVFTLVIALANVGFSLAPLGIDDIVNRRRLDAGPRLLGRTLTMSVPTGLVFALIGALVYDMSLSIALMIGLSTAAGGAMMVASGQFQSEQRFGLSLTLMQSPNLVLFVAALAVVGLGWRQAWVPIAIMTVGFVVAAAFGWRQLFRERKRTSTRDTFFPWREAVALAGVNAAGLLLVQLERLMLPHLLPLEELATYGVLAAVAGSLFRVLQMGIGYALIPRLRAAATVRERRRLLRHEATLAGGIVLLSAATIAIVTPLVERYVLDGKYQLPAALLVAAIVSGVAKLLNAFAKAAVIALANPREVQALNLLGWLSVAVAIGASIVGARWGLAGVIYGVGLGWLVRAVSAFYVTARHLRYTPATAVGSASGAAQP
jgi:O-antigen/teichoic acid export membrane protein